MSNKKRFFPILRTIIFCRGRIWLYYFNMRVFALILKNTNFSDFAPNLDFIYPYAP
jgi:hypothetical protein